MVRDGQSGGSVKVKEEGCRMTDDEGTRGRTRGVGEWWLQQMEVNAIRGQ